MTKDYRKKIQNSDIINASDISQFNYCSISWYLQKLGYKPDSIYLDEGTKKHKKHGNLIDKTENYDKKSKFFKTIGFLFLIISLLFLVFEVIL